MKTIQKFTVMAGITLLSAPAAWSQTVDMSKATCEEVLAGPAEEAVVTAAWISGYYNGKRNNTRIVIKQLSENTAAVTKYCAANPKSKVLNAVNTVLGKKK